MINSTGAGFNTGVRMAVMFKALEMPVCFHYKCGECERACPSCPTESWVDAHGFPLSYSRITLFLLKVTMWPKTDFTICPRWRAAVEWVYLPSSSINKNTVICTRISKLMIPCDGCEVFVYRGCFYLPGISSPVVIGVVFL